MIHPNPTIEDIRRTQRFVSGDLPAKRLDLAVEFARTRADAIEEAAKLCEATRCRKWSPEECAHAIRAILHPATCAMHRWQPCDCARGGS